MSEPKYSGWANKPTWLVKLWIDNDEGLAHQSREMARQCAADDADDRAGALSVLASELSDWMEEIAPPADGLFRDLLSHALATVDWRGVADALLDDYCEGVFSAPEEKS